MPSTAHYNDGLSAARHTVALTLGARTLVGADAAAAIRFEWPLAHLRAVAPARPGEPLRLKLDGGDARLTVEDRAMVAALLAAAPQLERGRPVSRRAQAVTIALGVAAIAALGVGLVVAAPAIAVRLIDPGTEAEIGRVVEDAVLGDPKVCRTPAGSAALAALVDRLTTIPAFEDTPIRVAVVDQPSVNAIALPGGRVYLFRGLVERASGPDAVAGVLAHELGHVLERHAVRNLARSLALSFIVATLTGSADDIVAQAVSFGGVAALMRYSREAEAEADTWALRLLTAADVSTDGLADFFAMVQEIEDGTLFDDGSPVSSAPNEPAPREPSWALGSMLASHPDTGAREQRFRDRARPRPPALDPRQWQALQAICR